MAQLFGADSTSDAFPLDCSLSFSLRACRRCGPRGFLGRVTSVVSHSPLPSYICGSHSLSARKLFTHTQTGHTRAQKIKIKEKCASSHGCPSQTVFPLTRYWDQLQMTSLQVFSAFSHLTYCCMLPLECLGRPHTHADTHTLTHMFSPPPHTHTHTQSLTNTERHTHVYTDIKSIISPHRPIVKEIHREHKTRHNNELEL